MGIDKGELLYGIEGQLRGINIDQFVFSRKYNRNVKSSSDVSKLKASIKKDIEARFKGIVSYLNLDSNWLSSCISLDIVESLGKLPTSSLKYLEDDIIVALTNYCTNMLIPDLHLSILPYNTSVNRFLILFLFTSDCIQELRKRFNVTYCEDISTNIISRHEISHATNMINSNSVSDADIKHKYMDFLKELGITNNQDLLTKMLDKFINTAYDDYRKQYLNKILQFKFKGIAFITHDKNYSNTNYYTVGILCGGYDNTVDRYNNENPYTDWKIWSTAFIFSFVMHYNNIGFVQQNICCDCDTISANLSSVQRIGRYGNLTKSFDAYKDAVRLMLDSYIQQYELGERLNKASYNNFINKVINARNI